MTNSSKMHLTTQQLHYNDYMTPQYPAVMKSNQRKYEQRRGVRETWYAEERAVKATKKRVVTEG